MTRDLMGEKIVEATSIFENLKKECLNTSSRYFSVTSSKSIERTCTKINDFCRLLREIKHASGRKWPQLCVAFSMNVRFFKDSKCKIVLEGDGKERKVIPFLYTYLEKVGIMENHLGKNDYITSLGLGLGEKTNYNSPLTDKQKHGASVKIAVAIAESKFPVRLTQDQKLDIYNDIQQKAENARFLRKLNEFCCIGDDKRTSTKSGIGHEKHRFIIKKFIDVMEILTEERRQDSSSEGTSSSINTIPQSQSSIDSNGGGKRRLSSKERKDKKRKRS